MYENVFNDGFTYTGQKDVNENVISEAFTPVNPFLSEEEAEERRKSTASKILLENVKAKKSKDTINMKKKGVK